jgi:hypothetical protein
VTLDPRAPVDAAMRDVLTALDPAARQRVAHFLAHPVSVEQLPDYVRRAVTGQTVRPSVDDFLGMLHPAGFVDLRAIHPRDDADQKVIARTYPAADLAAVRRFIETYGRERNLYVGVAPRNGHGRRTEHCVALHVLFVDLDVKQFPGGESEARARLAAFPLPPTAVVSTGGGLHVYWWLVDPLTLQGDGAALYAKAVLRALATQIGADLDAAEPARVLRLPDTRNHKYDPPRPVILETFDAARRYPLSDFADLLALGIEAELRQLESVPDPGPPIQHDIRVEARIQLAKRWLAQQPAGAVQGFRPRDEAQAGDNEAFTVCTAVTRGFDLEDSEALEALQDWNARCDPPWPASKLKDKIRNGREYGKERIGGRLHPSHEASRLLTLQPASEIAMRRAVYLWQQRLPLGMLSLLAGREGLGKSLLSQTIAADLTRGRLSGCHGGSPKGVIIVATEDAWEYVILPRLKAAGADLSRCFRVNVTSTKYGSVEVSLPEDLPALKPLVEQHDVALILLDPIISRLGKKLDTHVDAEVRQALEPLRAFAETLRLSVLGIIHPNKSQTGIPIDPLNAIMGSRAFSAVSRSTLFLQADHGGCPVVSLAHQEQCRPAGTDARIFDQ